MKSIQNIVKGWNPFCKGLQILIATSTLLILNPGCSSYVDVKPLNTITEDNYWSSKEDAIRGVNGVYNILRNSGFNEGLFPITDIMSDDGRKGSNPADALSNIGDPFERFQVNASTENTASWYNTLYQGVRRANSVIGNVPDIAMDDATKNRVLGEARFLRALFYLDLARAFGNVPFVVTVQPPPVSSVRQATDKEIYNEIIKPDLLFAIENLSGQGEYTGNDVGRATKEAAHALLARAALFFSEFDVARDHAVSVIDGNKFSLEADFSMAFRPEGNFGKESVFEIGAIGQEPFYTEDRGGNQYGNVQGVRGSPNRGWGFKRPSMGLLRAFESGDQRKEKTIIRLNEVLDGVSITGDGSTPDVTMDPQTNDTLEFECYNEKVWTPGVNVPSAFAHHRRFIRYSDVLLMAAEGMIETGNMAKAAEYINIVRARARNGVSGIVPDVPVGDLAAMRAAVYHERRVELALEDTRFFDLIRTGRQDLMVPLGFVKGKHEHMPIPQVEIDISGGKIKQNPQY